MKLLPILVYQRKIITILFRNLNLFSLKIEWFNPEINLDKFKVNKTLLFDSQYKGNSLTKILFLFVIL